MFAHPEFRDRGYAVGLGLASCAVEPVLDEDHRLGVLAVMGPRGSAFSDEDLELLQVLASYAAAVIRNAQIHGALAASSEAMRIREEYYRLLFTHGPQPMLLYDKDTFAILDLNTAAVGHYGFSREELLAYRPGR